MNGVGKSVVLIGMTGAGKSSVGRCLQRRTKLKLLDIDEIVASKLGMSISEIFVKHGEDKFRKAEAEAVRGLETTEEAIIVTGGGIVMSEENIDLLKRLGVVFWLDSDEKTLFERASRSGKRPLLQSENPRKAFAQILRARRPLYANIAHLRLDTSVFTDEEVAVAILSKLVILTSEPASAIPAKAS